MVKKRKITEAQKMSVVQSLSQGLTQKQAAKIAGTNRESVRTLAPQSVVIKKEVAEAIKKKAIEDITDVTEGMLKGMRDCLRALTPESIADQSAAAIATTLGILTDKRQLLTGGYTANVQLDAGSKDGILARIRARKQVVEVADVKDPVVTASLPLTSSSKVADNAARDGEGVGGGASD